MCHKRRGASSVMRKIYKKNPRDVIQSIWSSYCIDNLFSRKYAGNFDISCGKVISLVLRDNDRDSENVSLVQHSVSDGQKTRSSKDVSLMGI